MCYEVHLLELKSILVAYCRLKEEEHEMNRKPMAQSNAHCTDPLPSQNRPKLPKAAANACAAKPPTCTLSTSSAIKVSESKSDCASSSASMGTGARQSKSVGFICLFSNRSGKYL